VTDGHDAGRTRDFLLGRLGGKTRREMERRLFDDDEAFERVRATEDQLVEEYVRGELRPTSREAFERRVLASAAGRREVHIARACRQVLEGERRASSAAAPAAAGLPARRVAGRLMSWATPRNAARLAFAAALAAAVSTSLYFESETRRLRERLAEADAARQRATVAAERARSALEDQPRPEPLPPAARSEAS
jgi:hypothetical protein